MFRGVSAINIDSKGRMMMPAKHREPLQSNGDGQLVVTVDTEERCLLLYPLPVWNKIETQIEALPSFNQAARRVQRLLIGHATDVELDNQGRILLPSPLREYAGLGKNVMLVGQGKKLEIWDAEYWTHQCEAWVSNGNAKISEAELPQELRVLSL